MEEQAAQKCMNEEQTAPLKTALLHIARDALAVRIQMRTAQRGGHSNPVDRVDRVTQGWSSLPVAGLTCQFAFWLTPAARWTFAPSSGSACKNERIDVRNSTIGHP